MSETIEAISGLSEGKILTIDIKHAFCSRWRSNWTHRARPPPRFTPTTMPGYRNSSGHAFEIEQEERWAELGYVAVEVVIPGGGRDPG
jgi:hypothetical protein